MLSRYTLFLLAACVGLPLPAQDNHDHRIPENLGKVSFPVSCAAKVQDEFNRGVALLHSFSYAAANLTFRKIAFEDPTCAMAHWGVAMSVFHQLWEPHFSPAAMSTAQEAIRAAERIGSSSSRERDFIGAFSLLVKDDAGVPFSVRNQRYEQAMAAAASAGGNDVELQVFYALALLSNASPADKSHSRQKQALKILEPLDQTYRDHPGITHYIIHACDSSELASRGLPAARRYAQIAPSAPHALHMPSHIFTRLGLWQDSIASNVAASRAAGEQGDIGEQLHAMDYLVYAYLQTGADQEALQVLAQLNRMNALGVGDFKVGYAATAMPVRYAVERHRWDEAAKMEPLPGSAPHIAAIAVWARALGRTRGAHPSNVDSEIDALSACEKQLRASGNDYWAAQTSVLRKEATAWAAQAQGNTSEAEAQLRRAADEEDAIEKLPVTPGPILPAREQLAELLALEHRKGEAMTAFETALRDAPNRKGALDGIEELRKSP